jgi:hypothetical protein
LSKGTSADMFIRTNADNCLLLTVSMEGDFGGDIGGNLGGDLGDARVIPGGCLKSI